MTGIAEGDLVYAYMPHQTAYVAPAASLIRLPELKNPAQGVLLANITTAFNGVLDTRDRPGRHSRRSSARVSSACW